MKIDENRIDAELIKNGKNPIDIKNYLKGLIAGSFREEKPTDLLILCDKTGLSPTDTTALYHLLLPGIEEAEGKAPNLVSDSINQLQLDDGDSLKPLSKGYRLVVDPQYTTRFIMVSDTHIGAMHDNIPGIERMFDHASKIGVKDIFHAGDLVNGAFAHRDMYLYNRGDCKGHDEQLDRIVQFWPKRDGITTYFIAGNHDHFFWINAGVDICRHIDIARKDMVYLKSSSIAEAFGRRDLDEKKLKEIIENKQLGSGRAGAIRIGPHNLPMKKRNTILMLFHPGDGSARTTSYAPQKVAGNLDLLLNSFENMQSPQGKKIKPHILGIGHYHKADLNILRNVYVFQAGTMVLPDQFHEVKNLNSMAGYWVIETNTKSNGDIVTLESHFQRPYIPTEKYTRTVVQQKER